MFLPHFPCLLISHRPRWRMAMSAFRYVLPSSRTQRVRLAACFLLVAAERGVNLAVPVLFKQMVDEGNRGQCLPIWYSSLKFMQSTIHLPDLFVIQSQLLIHFSGGSAVSSGELGSWHEAGTGSFHLCGCRSGTCGRRAVCWSGPSLAPECGASH